MSIFKFFRRILTPSDINTTSHYDLLTLYLIAPKPGHTNLGFTHSDSGAPGEVGAL